MVTTRTLVLSLCLLVGTCLKAQGTYETQPPIEARATEILYEGPLKFKDLNKNGAWTCTKTGASPYPNA